MGFEGHVQRFGGRLFGSAGVLCKPGNPTTNATEGDYTHLDNFLRLSSMQKVVLFVGCSSRGLGGLLSKTAVSEVISGSRAVHTCCCSYCCMAGDLARDDQAHPSKIYCHKRDINLSRAKVCSVYHLLRKCTPGDRAFYLHRAGPGAMGHGRCLKGYDEKQRGTVLGSETISLVSCHMTFKPPQADSPESSDHVLCTLQSCHGAVVAALSGVPQEGS